MHEQTLLKNCRIVNEGKIIEADLLMKGTYIERIASKISDVQGNFREIDVKGKLLMPGIIDDQVHFREPGLTQKADIGSESIAAIAGGVTSFMEMPNTKPPAVTQELLQDKYDIAARSSKANYSFFMGTTNDNFEEVMKTDPERVCGVKIFMGSSTGNMLVDEPSTLDHIFSESPLLIATHCEDESTVRANTAAYQQRYGEDIPFSAHPEIRSVEACFKSSSLAVELAKQHDTRLHILHISTAEELELFRNDIPLEEKRITSEVCVHHMYFDASQYDTLGSHIKCNPAIKEARHKAALLEGLKSGKLDIIATDHAPHTAEEKGNKYLKAPSGLPLVQHAMNIMLDFYHRGELDLPFIVEKMCHAPAKCFRLRERGYIREGYKADLILVDPDLEWTIDKSNLLYKCGWSPLEGMTMRGKVTNTFVNGYEVWNGKEVQSGFFGERLSFEAKR